MNDKSAAAVKAAVDAVMRSNHSPAAKRKTLLRVGIRTDYLPHQGKKEVARRLSKIQQVKA